MCFSLISQVVSVSDKGARKHSRGDSIQVKVSVHFFFLLILEAFSLIWLDLVSCRQEMPYGHTNLYFPRH